MQARFVSRSANMILGRVLARRSAGAGSTGTWCGRGCYLSGLLLMAVSAVLCSVAVAEEPDPLAVPAEFVAMLDVPGSLDDLLRPGKVFYDRAADELYVADQGNNRLVVFDRNGAYRFEFPMGEHVGSVVDFVVSPTGIVYVLASTRGGHCLMRYDFDGLYLGEVGGDASELMGTSISTMALDGDQRLYLLDEAVPRLLRLTESGAIDLDVPILTDIDDSTRQELVFGSLAVVGDELLLPTSSVGTVYRFDLDGNRVGRFGYKGSAVGAMNFPVAVGVSGDGLLMVLDKRRFNVLCYTPEGRFVGEFGGKGISPGWFYFPSSLATDALGHVYISQVHLNRVQICRVPDSIHDRYLRDHPVDSGRPLGSGVGYQEHDQTEIESNGGDAHANPTLSSNLQDALTNNIKGGL